MPCHHALYVGQTPGSPSPCLLHVLPPVAQPSAARHCRACPCPLVVLGQRSDPATTLGRAMLHIAKRAARRRPAARHCTDTAFPIQRTGDIRQVAARRPAGDWPLTPPPCAPPGTRFSAISREKGTLCYQARDWSRSATQRCCLRTLGWCSSRTCVAPLARGPCRLSRQSCAPMAYH